MNDQATSEETKANPEISGSEGTSEPSGEINSENKTESSDYASKSNDEQDWKKRYTDSSREAHKMREELKVLREKVNSIETEANPQVVEPANTLGYDRVVQSLLKDNIAQITQEVEDQFSEVVKNPQTSKKMLEYTRKNIIQSNGIYLDAITREPLTPNEYRRILTEGAILAGNDVYIEKVRNESKTEGLAQRKFNDLGKTIKVPVASGSKETIDVPTDVMQQFKKLGVTDAEMPEYAKAWREKNK